MSWVDPTSPIDGTYLPGTPTSADERRASAHTGQLPAAGIIRRGEARLGAPDLVQILDIPIDAAQAVIVGAGIEGVNPPVLSNAHPGLS